MFHELSRMILSEREGMENVARSVRHATARYMTEEDHVEENLDANRYQTAGMKRKAR